MAYFTDNISENECIGDSLHTINSNFLSLDTRLYDVPSVKPSLNVSQELNTNLQNGVTIQHEPNNSLYFAKQFDGLNAQAVVTNINLGPQTTISCTKFNYINSTNNIKPTGSFIVPAFGKYAPELTVFWSTSGTEPTTKIYPLNVTLNNNGYITALHKTNNFLYIGGNFTQINGQQRNGFAVISLSGGALETEQPGILQGNVGSIVSDPVTQAGGFAIDLKTTVNVIKTYNNFLLVGGDFTQQTASELRAANLIIADQTTSAIYGFYVNGIVNDIQIVDNGADVFAYVVGHFDYIQKTGSTIQLTNGIAKISLTTLVSNPAASLNNNNDFHQYAIQKFYGPADIKTITAKNEDIYIGGQFSVKDNSQRIMFSNMLRLNQDKFDESWRPWVMGVVNNLETARVESGEWFLLVAGDFDGYIEDSLDFYRRPQIKKPHLVSNLIKLSLEENIPQLNIAWKPMFNKPIKSIKFQNLNQQDQVYCYGEFTTINEIPVNYLAAVNLNEQQLELVEDWYPAIQTPSTFQNNVLSLDIDGVIVGGSFKRINNFNRNGLAKLSFSPSNTNNQKRFTLEAGLEVVGSSLKISDSHLKIQTVICNANAPAPSINSTTFPRFMFDKGTLTKGQLCRGYIKRLGPLTNSTNDERDNLENIPIYILGYSLNFDK